MDAEEFEIKLANLESRIRYLEQDQQDNQGQNAQLPPFVPIPVLGDADDQLTWTFQCTVGTDGTRTGGWCNGQAQLGLDAHWFGDYGITRTLSSSGRIEDCDQTEDGAYYLEVKPSARKMTLKRYDPNENAPENDYENDTYYVYIGTVEDAKQTDGIYSVPVIYNYL